ncbi:MAG: MFS transporter [Ruminococcaceae bacterium]|nr:MFS transporter [Oscillospiraceae bacterium]
MKKFGFKDKIGYMLGDLGNDFFFILASSFLMVFYTKVLGISGGVVGTLFLLARILDAFTDITMGRIVDMAPLHKNGRFRPWILRMCVPVVLTGIFMFIPAAKNLPYWGKLVYIYVSYLIWGSICYTGINIPYGSMASVITDDPVERTALSTFRSIGAAIAGVVVGAGVPLIIYTYDSQGNQLIVGERFLPIAVVFGIFALVCYLLCYYMTQERVVIPTTVRSKQGIKKSLAAMSHNRALWAIIAAAIVLLLSTLLSGTMNVYLFMDYFKSKEAMSVAGFLQTACTLILAPFSGILTKKFGKKEVSGIAVLFASVIFFLLFLLRIQNPWIFCLFLALGNFGSGLFNLMIWAFITDVIDNQEAHTGTRSDGTIYAMYSFARKIGQALAGSLGGYTLTLIGYVSSTENIIQTPAVTQRIYTVSTLVPAICYFLVAIILMFWYPLTRKKIAENQRLISQHRREINANSTPQNP